MDNGEVVVSAPLYKWVPGKSGKGPPPGFPTSFNAPSVNACNYECQQKQMVGECVAYGMAYPSHDDIMSDTRRGASQSRYIYEYAGRAAANILLYNVGKSIGQCIVDGGR